jgi:hypothetical protein
VSENAQYDAQGNEIVQLDSLLPSVLQRVSAIPYTLAVEMLRTKYNEFARETGCVRMTLRIETQKDVARYPLPIPPGYFLHTVRSIDYGRFGGFNRLPDHWRSWAGHYRGRRTYIDDSDALVLGIAPRQDENHDIHVRVQLVPRTDVDCLPAWVANTYGDAIGAGAAGEAMNIRGKPWYDPGNSVRVMRLYYKAINNARANAERDKMSTLYMRAHRWI